MSKEEKQLCFLIWILCVEVKWYGNALFTSHKIFDRTLSSILKYKINSTRKCTWRNHTHRKINLLWEFIVIVIDIQLLVRLSLLQNSNVVYYCADYQNSWASQSLINHMNNIPSFYTGRQFWLSWTLGWRLPTWSSEGNSHAVWDSHNMETPSRRHIQPVTSIKSHFCVSSSQLVFF